jgi:hypothetical protein
MPKGNYDSSATYEMLDLVGHNGKSWLAKKTAKGIEPSAANSEYWHLMFNLDNKLDTSGGTLTGGLGLGGGSGHLNADTVYASLQVAKDGSNFRYLRIMNPLQENFPVDQAIQWADTVDGKETVYNLFGEHNIDYLKQLLGLA